MEPRRRTLVRGGILAAIMVLGCSVAQAAPKYKVLHPFGKGSDGAGLWSSVTLGQNGNLYGATSGGGTYGLGIVFKLTPQADGSWTETVLHSFPSFPDDGQGPNGGLVEDNAGSWYGTTIGGGTYHTAGTVFELTNGPSGWQETVLYNFGSHKNDGGEPTAGVVIDMAGNLYGTTPNSNGITNGGTAFRLRPGSKGWEETVLHRFGVKNGDGVGPYAGLIPDASGNLYGTTGYGGTGCSGEGCGTVYELSPQPDGKWKETILHRFDDNGTDGVEPGGGALFMDSSGILYGTTAGGGTNTGCAGAKGIGGPSKSRESPNVGNCGTVFKLTREASGRWKEAILHDFAPGAGGYLPGSGVVMDKSGNLYGTTDGGGAVGCGVLYKLAPTAKGKWKYSVLHTFGRVGDGCLPQGNLVLDSNGNLYGGTAVGGQYGGGVVFELTP